MLDGVAGELGIGCLVRMQVCLGPNTREYTNADKLVEVMKSSGCCAVHPGYGFLSESTEFAEKCAAAGITYSWGRRPTRCACSASSTPRARLPRTQRCAEGAPWSTDAIAVGAPGPVMSGMLQPQEANWGKAMSPAADLFHQRCLHAPPDRVTGMNAWPAIDQPVTRAEAFRHEAHKSTLMLQVPVLSGSGLLTSADEAVALASKVGFPVLLKATGGGGGIGIYICHSAEEVASQYEVAGRQGKANFGDAGAGPIGHMRLQSARSRCHHCLVVRFSELDGWGLLGQLHPLKGNLFLGLIVKKTQLSWGDMYGLHLHLAECMRQHLWVRRGRKKPIKERIFG